MINKTHLHINSHDHELLFHIKSKLVMEKFPLQTILHDPTEEKESELIVIANNNGKIFYINEIHDILEKIPEYKEDVLQNSFIELGDERENHYFLYQNNSPIMTLHFHNEDFYVTCLDLKLLENLAQHELIKKFDHELLQYEEVLRYKFGSCMIYKNVNQIPNLYSILSDILNNKYQKLSKEQGDSVQKLLFALSIKNFLSCELKKMNNLLQTIKQDHSHLLKSHQEVLKKSIDIFNFLYRSNLNIKSLKSNKLPKYHVTNLRNAFTYQNEFDTTPSAIMNSFIKFNQRFRNFTEMFLEE